MANKEIKNILVTGSVGQIAFIVKGRRCTSSARTQKDQTIERDQNVVITRVDGSTCYVVPKEG